MFKHSRTLPGRPSRPGPEDFEQASELFRALGDVTRLRILDALGGGELRVQEIAAALGMTQSAISHQLATLRALRIVRARRQGKSIYYSIDDAHVKRLFEQGMQHVGHG